MPDRPTIRIFISSPSDVRPERLKAEQIIARLDCEFAYHFHVEAVLWEREPLVATHHFQDARNIPRARHADIVVVILWSRPQGGPGRGASAKRESMQKEKRSPGACRSRFLRGLLGNIVNHTKTKVE
jgi:hypothetical protein